MISSKSIQPRIDNLDEFWKEEYDFQIKFFIYDWDKFSQNDHIATKLDP